MRFTPRLIAALLGLLWFLHIGGGPTLDPLNVAWLYDGDWMQHWLGFVLFQREPWTWPIGSLPSLLYPIGTNIGFTDSNPLLALSIKPFAMFLPSEYQLIGPWLCACFVLQGYAGAALAGAVTSNPVNQTLGGALFVLSPVLLARIGHDTLCAHWLLIGLLSLGLRDYSDPTAARKSPWMATGLVILAATVHPYLAVIGWVLAGGVLGRLWRSRLLPGSRALLWLVLATAGMAAVWWAIGYLVKAPDLAVGFGRYSADLLTFVNPRGLSKSLPDLPGQSAQGEGLAFLGLGGMIGMATAIVAFAIRRPMWRLGIGVPLVAVLLMAVYALSWSVRFAGEEVLQLKSIYQPFESILRPFRSSGRFIWPLHYVLLASGIWGVTRLAGRGREWLGTLFLAIVVVLQVSDMQFGRGWAMPKASRQISLAPFELASGYRHLALVPMQVAGACLDPIPVDYVYPFQLLAHRLRLTFNSGYAARVDARQVSAQCRALEDTIDARVLDLQTIYVVAPAELERFRSARAACGRWDGHWYCVVRRSNPRFATYLETGVDPGFEGPK